MTVSYVDSSNVGSSGSTTSQAFTRPSAAQTGDIMICTMSVSVSTDDVTAPSGWSTLLASLISGATMVTYQFMRIADATDTAGTTYTFSSATSRSWAGGISAYRGQKVSPIDGTGKQTNPSSTVVLFPAITNANDDDMLIAGAHLSTGTTASTITLPTSPGFTERFDVSAISGAQRACSIGDVLGGTAGTVTPGDGSGTNAGQNQAWVVGISPLVGGAPTSETLRPTSTRNVSAAFTPNTDPSAYIALSEDPDASNLTDPLNLADPSGSPTNTGNTYVNGPASSTAWSGGTAPTHGTYANLIDASDTTSDAITMAATNTDYQNYLSFTAAQFSGIPAGSTINSITATYIHTQGTTNRVTAFLTLATANGTILGTEQTVSPSGTSQNSTVTSAWGAVPTLAQLTSGTFGFRLRMRRSNTVTYTIFALRVVVNYTPPGSTVNTSAEVLMDNPVGTLATGAGTGEVRVAINKKGTGSNPTLRAEIHENASATVLATPIADTAVTVSGSVTVLAGTFNQSVITNKNNVEVWLIGTGAAGGAVEFDAVEWNATLAAGASLSQTVNVGVSVGATLARGIGKSLANSVSGIFTPQKGVGKSIARPASATPTPQKSVGKSAAFSASGSATVGRIRGVIQTISVGASAASTLGKSVGKAISRPVSATPTPQKAVGKSLPFSPTIASVLIASRTYLRTISVGITSAPSIVKSTGKNIATPISTTFTRVLSVGKTIPRGISATSTQQKSVGKALPFSSTIASALTVSRTYLRTISFGISSTTTLAKNTGKTLATPISTAFTRVLSVGKTVARGVSATPTQQRATGKTLPFAPTITYTLTRIKGVVTTLVFGSTASPTVRKDVGKSITRPISATFSRILGAGKSIPVTVTTTLSISTQAIIQYFKTVGVNISTAPSVRKAVGATRSFPISGALSIPKAITKTIARPVSAVFTKVSSVGKTLARPVTASVSMGNKAIGKNVNQPVSATPTLGNKAISKTISRGVTVLVDVSTGAFFNIQRTLAFTATAAPTVKKGITRSLTFTRVLSASTIRTVGKTANFNITSDTTIKKAVIHIISVNVNNAFTILRGFNKTLQFALSTTRSINKAVEKTFNYVTNTDVSNQKATEKALSFDIYATVRYIKHIGMSINVNVSVAVDIIARLAGLITGPIDITISVVKKPQALFQSIPKPQAITRVVHKVFARIRKEE